MFLRPLNNRQKELFMELALHAAAANDVIEESEKALLYAYADEMDIKPIEKNEIAFEDVLTELKSISSDKELNQITFEIVAMIMSDMDYDDDEKLFMDKISKAWEISQEKIDEMFELIKEYMNLTKRINIVLFA